MLHVWSSSGLLLWDKLLSPDASSPNDIPIVHVSGDDANTLVSSTLWYLVLLLLSVALSLALQPQVFVGSGSSVTCFAREGEMLFSSKTKGRLVDIVVGDGSDGVATAVSVSTK